MDLIYKCTQLSVYLEEILHSKICKNKKDFRYKNM